MRDLKALVPVLALSGWERFKQIPVRVALSCGMAWGLYDSGNEAWIAPWIILVSLVQLFEIWAMSPFRHGRPVTNLSIILALLSTTTMATAFSVMAALVWMMGDYILATMAALTLYGGLMTNVASGIGSRVIFAIGSAPYLVVLLVMPMVPLFTRGIGDAALMLSVSILGIFSIMNVYVRVYSMRKVEVIAVREAEKRLNQAQTAMAERAAMAAIISHELRTPVSAILAGAQTVRDGASAERREETADLIIDAGRLMTGMLNDLLDHSKMGAGAMTLERRDFDLADFVRNTGRFWSAAAAQKGLTLEVSDMGPDPIWLKGDPSRLRQIVNNLMSNAMKFSTQGVVRLSATVQPRDLGHEVRLMVTDQGVGISPEAMDRLFTPFTQASSEVARTYGGSGLGLSVSRDLARLMGGDLTADSAEGKGAAFMLTVTLPQGRPDKVEADADATAAPAVRPLRVLAVDDHEINRRTIAVVLHPLQVELVTASSGHEALRFLDEQVFDVVLMDVNMPGLDGNEATRRLRAGSGVNCHVPVIGFSAGTAEKEIQACYQAGMTDWLAKPLETRKLYDALQRAVTSAPADAVHAA